MEQKYAEPLILCPPMQLNIIKMYVLSFFMVQISKKQESMNNHSKYFVSFVISDLIKERSIIMKGLNVLAAFLGGAAVGAAIGILFAPEKGEDTRHKIAEILRKKGIRLNRNEMENLVDEIAAEIKGEAND